MENKKLGARIWIFIRILFLTILSVLLAIAGEKMIRTVKYTLSIIINSNGSFKVYIPDTHVFAYFYTKNLCMEICCYDNKSNLIHNMGNSKVFIPIIE